MEKTKSLAKQSIRVSGEKLVIDHLVVNDSDVANYFGDVPVDKAEGTFLQAVRVGTQALRTMQTYQGIDLIEKRFQALDRRFKDRLEDAFDQMDQELEAKFGEDGEVSKLVQDHFGEKGKVEEIFDPGKEGSVTYSLLTEFRKELQSLRELIERESGKSEVLQLSPKKGPKFEDWCEDILCEIAKRQQPADLVETVKASQAYFGSKKGDFKIVLGDNRKWKIAVEVKDLTSRISANKIRSYLKAAMENRDAQYAVLFVRNVECLPKSLGFFNELEGDMLVCALGSRDDDSSFHPEVIDIAYKWSKLRVLAESASKLHLNPARMLRRVDSIRGRMNEFKGVLDQCRAVQRVVDEMESRIESLRNDLNAELRDLLAEVKTESK